MAEHSRSPGESDRAGSERLGADEPAPRHRRPEGVDDATVRAVGRLTEALETTERARGHLYEFHQLTGAADAKLCDAVELLRTAGHEELAAEVERDLVGRNVLPGRWTFQVVEEYDDGYWNCFRAHERHVRHSLVDGRRHLSEAEMKERERSTDEGIPLPGHASTPESGR